MHIARILGFAAILACVSSLAAAQTSSSAGQQSWSRATGVTVSGQTTTETPVRRTETDADRIRRIKELRVLRARNEPKGNAGASYTSGRLYNTNPQTLSTGVVADGQIQSATPDERSVPIAAQRQQQGAVQSQTPTR